MFTILFSNGLLYWLKCFVQRSTCKGKTHIFRYHVLVTPPTNVLPVLWDHLFSDHSISDGVNFFNLHTCIKMAWEEIPRFCYQAGGVNVIICIETFNCIVYIIKQIVNIPMHPRLLLLLVVVFFNVIPMVRTYIHVIYLSLISPEYWQGDTWSLSQRVIYLRPNTPYNINIRLVHKSVSIHVLLLHNWHVDHDVTT